MSLSRLLDAMVSADRPVWIARVVIAALSCVAVVAVHTAEVATVIGLVILAGGQWLRGERDLLTTRRAMIGLAAVGLVTTAMLLPILPQLVGGGSERIGFEDKPEIALSAAFAPFVLLGSYSNFNQPLMAALAIAGVAVALWRHEQVAWLAGWAGVAALYFLAETRTGAIVTAFTFPWYQQPERIAYNVAYFVPVFGALALEATAAALRSLFGHDPRLMLASRPIAIGGAVALGVVLAVIPTARLTVDDLGKAIESFAPVDKAALAGFEFLADHVAQDERVLNDENYDGSLWMYAFEGVSPLFALLRQTAPKRQPPGTIVATCATTSVPSGPTTGWPNSSASSMCGTCTSTTPGSAGHCRRFRAANSILFPG